MIVELRTKSRTVVRDTTYFLLASTTNLRSKRIELARSGMGPLINSHAMQEYSFIVSQLGTHWLRVHEGTFTLTAWNIIHNKYDENEVRANRGKTGRC